MPGNMGSIRFSLREPFERAVESVCRSLSSRGLRVAGQLDVSLRVERSLGIVLPPCRSRFRSAASLRTEYGQYPSLGRGLLAASHRDLGLWGPDRDPGAKQSSRGSRRLMHRRSDRSGDGNAGADPAGHRSYRDASEPGRMNGEPIRPGWKHPCARTNEFKPCCGEHRRGPAEMANGVPEQRRRAETAQMNIATTGNTRVIREPFGKAVAVIRRLLSDAGLSVVEEFNVSSEPYFQLGIASRSCLILLVDTPALLFESIALDRSAAVFVPVHVVISGDRDTSYVHWANPVTTSGLRPPTAAKIPLERLCARITRALSALPLAAEGTAPVQPTESKNA